MTECKVLYLQDKMIAKRDKFSLKIKNLIKIVFAPKSLTQSVMLNVLQSPELSSKRALLYYKTAVFQNRKLLHEFRHTNNSEIYEMAEILNQRGFIVDVIDRTANWEEIQKLKTRRYDLFLSNASGNSAPFHSRILNEFNVEKKVLFAAGPEPFKSNELVTAQHEHFMKRSGIKCKVLRLVNGTEFNERFQGLTAIFYVGNSFSQGTYKQFGLPLLPIHPSSSPKLCINEEQLQKKSPKQFIYLGGTGLICKGLDLVLEAFDGLNDLHLDICGPSDEKDFWDYYAPLLKRNPQIKFHGFVDVNGPVFEEISSRAAFYVFPSSAEGCATSVTTCMRRGVIPVVNFEVGVDIDDFGVEIRDRSIPALKQLIQSLAQMPQDEVFVRAQKTYKASEKYTQKGFRQSFIDALDRVFDESKHSN